MDDATSRDNNTHCHDSEEEEALSLSGFVSNSHDDESMRDDPQRRQDVSISSSSEPSDFFEFFSDLGSEMSHAEDIIFCGKLIPFKEQNQPNHSHVHKQPTRDDKLRSLRGRRCESMSEAIASRNSTKSNLMRNSRSMDYQKLYGNPKLRSEKMEIERSLSSKSSGKSDVPGMKEKVPLISKSRWYFLTFGLVKIPHEMALQDIKSRQIRRNPGTLFSSFHADENGNIVNRDDRRSSWDLLKVLSCKDDASVAVTASFGCLQHV